MTIIRRLHAREWPAYRDLRLSALRDSPDSFGSTLEWEEGRSDAEWARRLVEAESSAADLPLVAESDGRFVGLTWARLDASSARTCHVHQMWVAPDSRRHGVGAMLLDAAILWAKAAGAAHVALSVTHGNGPAERLYRACGFLPFGDPGPLRPNCPLLSQPMRLDL